MKIAVLYICTGRYVAFWQDFYESAERFLLPGHEKEYFVFTDADRIAHEEEPRVHRIFQKSLPWPYPTLLRFHIFLQVEQQLERADHVFFFNANMRFVSEISADELLPDPVEEDGLTVALHSGYMDGDRARFPYENTQEKSLAFMKEGRHYFQGCLSGGTRDAYLELIRQLKRNVQADLDNGIIAVWHDESHLNKYVAERRPRILSPAFAHPEGKTFGFAPRILLLDKKRHGGHSYMRGEKESFSRKLKRLFKKVTG